MKRFHFQFQKEHNGFTLMEVMVSVSIFAIIVTIGIGSLLTIYNTLKKTRADQQVMDSLSFVMDTMTRRIRTGYDYTGGVDSISLKDQFNVSITYESGIDPNNTNLRRLYFSEDGGIPYDITPDNLDMSNFEIILHTSSGQPMVEIHLEGTIKNGRNETPLSVQTIVSQRPFTGSGSNLLPSSGSQNTLDPLLNNTGTGDIIPPPKNDPVQFIPIIPSLDGFQGVR